MTKALAHYGISDYKRDVTRCFARMPSPEDIRYLRQSESTPILAVESIDVDLEGAPYRLPRNELRRRASTDRVSKGKFIETRRMNVVVPVR